MPSISKIVSLATVLMMVTPGLAAPASVDRRQIGGEAQLLYQTTNNIDNGVGFGSENLLNGVAEGIKPGSSNNTPEQGEWGDGSSPPPQKKRLRRQANKTSVGVDSVANAVGQEALGKSTEEGLNQLDGTDTEGVGELGTTLGGMEEGNLSEGGWLAGQDAKDVLQERPATGTPAAPAA
ncbi:hypothetical protein B0I35DRAFT_445790 [Stachybotrys elegans]|uniref:Uncharacterized protein n=1 Tax=Stachybotrys elegans TaxID=80388 RepID=A0A8K0WJB5_9HYPO|nr:hypothetical protein B0I35DRAFT_445790 [Stachybotrys elegans]